MMKYLSALVLFNFGLQATAGEAVQGGSGTLITDEAEIKKCLSSMAPKKKDDSVKSFSFRKVDADDPELKKIADVQASCNLDKLDEALAAQIQGCGGRPALTAGSEQIPSSRWCLDTNTKMKSMLAAYRSEAGAAATSVGFQKKMLSAFDFYQMDCNDDNFKDKPEEARGVRFTGYDAPKLKCTSRPVGKSKYPIYSKDSPDRPLGDYKWSDFYEKKEQPPKNILAYTDNLFDFYMLGIEGSGGCTMDGKDDIKLHIDDATPKKSNPMLSTVLFCMGVRRSECIGSDGPIPKCREKMNVPEMRAYFETHESTLKAGLDLIASVPFFEKVTRGPLGAMQIKSAGGGDSMPVQISDGHSLAVPPEVPFGAVALFQTMRPGKGQTSPNENFSCTAIAQDRGGAIKDCRVDWFAGSDREAAMASGTMAKERGTLFVAVSKK